MIVSSTSWTPTAAQLADYSQAIAALAARDEPVEENPYRNLAAAGPRVGVILNLDNIYSVEGNYFNVRPFDGEQSTPHTAGAYQMNGIAGFDPKLNVRPPFDPEGAKRLLADAGYPNGFEVEFDFPSGRYLKGEEVADVVAAHVEQRDHAPGRRPERAHFRHDDRQVGEGLRAGRDDHADARVAHETRGFAAAEIRIDEVEVRDLDGGAGGGE